VGPLERVEPPPPVRARRARLRRWSEALVVAFLIVTSSRPPSASRARSMEPTPADGERALVPRYETWAARLACGRGAAATSSTSARPGRLAQDLLERLGGPFVIKRIVAVGGQTVEARARSTARRR
jgi:signal peptidase I